jgi:hypothetical protein
LCVVCGAIDAFSATNRAFYAKIRYKNDLIFKIGETQLKKGEKALQNGQLRVPPISETRPERERNGAERETFLSDRINMPRFRKILFLIRPTVKAASACPDLITE